MDSKVDGERDHDNMAGKSLEMASPAEALAALGRAADAKGCGRAVTSLIWEHIINPFGRFGLDMGGKPGSISVQMALVTRLLGEPQGGAHQGRSLRHDL